MITNIEYILITFMLYIEKFDEDCSN